MSSSSLPTTLLPLNLIILVPNNGKLVAGVVTVPKSTSAILPKRRFIPVIDSGALLDFSKTLYLTVKSSGTGSLESCTFFRIIKSSSWTLLASLETKDNQTCSLVSAG